MSLGFFLDLAALGPIDARESARHPRQKERLGAPFASFSHESQWAGFVLFGHFSLRDPLLSALCVASVALWLAFAALLFGLWSPIPLAD